MLRPRHGFEHRFSLIRSLRASAQRSTPVLFSFVLSLWIVAGPLGIRQSKTILVRSSDAKRRICAGKPVVRPVDRTVSLTVLSKAPP